MERLEFDLLFRWFVGIGVDDAVWDHSVFSKNRDRLLEGEIAAKFLAAVLAQPEVKRLLSSDHFSVDGTLIEAWASMKSFKPKDGRRRRRPPAQGGGRNAEADFHGEKRSNETHASTTDPDARLYRKGTGMEAKLCFIGHGLMENRHGLLGRCPADAGLGPCRTVGGARHDRASCRPTDSDHARRRQGLRCGRLRQGVARDQRDAACRAEHQRPPLGDRRADDPPSGYAVSQRIRKRIEEAFGWMKTVAGQEKTKLPWPDRVAWAFTFAAAAYNLVRLPKLIAEAG